MADLTEKRARFMGNSLPIRLGNLASSLAHVSSFAAAGKNPDAVERLLGESRFLIEWTAPDTEVETAEELADMQVRLSAWYCNWRDVPSNPTELSTIATQTRLWSDRVLTLSGLLQETR